MAKKFRTDQIPSGNFAEDWGGSTSNTVPTASDESNILPYSGAAVQKFIKDSLQRCEKKIGCYKWSDNVDGSNYYHLLGFTDEDAYNEWRSGDKEDDAIKALVLMDEALPISTVQGDSYAAYLYSTIGNSTNIVVADGKLEVPLRFCAVRTSSGERINVGSKGTLVIQRKTATSSWTTVATLSEIITSSNYVDTNDTTAIEIGKYLINGSQNIRIQARYEYEDGEGKTQTQSSQYVPIGASIVSTQLSLICSQDWQTPIVASQQQSNGFPYSYTVYGATQKTLHIQITGGNGNVLSIEKELDSTKNGTTIRETYLDALDTYKLFKHGVRLVKAWLTCADGLGNTITSDMLENRFMIVNPTTEGAELTKPYILLQNVAKETSNYTQSDICEYAVFSPKVNADGNITNDGDNINVVFYLTSYSETFPSDNVTEYFRIEQNVEPGIINTLNTTVEIEAEGSQPNITAYFHVLRRVGDVETDMMDDAVGTDVITISVDNSESFTPTSGATFLLNPKVRNNTETNPRRIVNAKANNAIVESTWHGFGFVNDGWVTAEDGVKVLRIPAGATLNIKYNPFAQFLTTPNSSMTLELDVAMRNITNETDPIIQICELVGNKYIGLRMKPIEGYIYSASNQTDGETDFQWQEDTRTHIAINIHNAIIPNKGDALAPSDGTNLAVTATTIALVRVLINGDIEREVRFSGTNKEEFCTGAMSNGGITLGQSGADLDVYSIRCYTNMKLEASDIVKDYISTLPTVAEKQAMRKENDIMTGEKVDVEKVKALGKRVLILHGTEPYMYNQGAQKVWWEIFQYNADGSYNPDLSGTICKETRTKSKRQGSTANTYYYSNIQTKVSDGGKIVVALDKIHSSITWKLNDPVTDEATGQTTRTVSIYGGNLGAKDPVEKSAKEYDYVEVDGVPSVKVPDGWIDGNGMYRGVGFMITEGTPLADKLVLKVNYASSMQSHLCGCTRLYSDLHTEVVGKNSLQQACDTARVAKYTEPVFFFTQADDSTEVIYRGGGNFGGGKMDKPTWGYNKKVKSHGMFAMFEGSDNNYELTDMRVPFTLDTQCEEAITYSPSDEGYFYNGLQNLDFDGGKTQTDADGNESPVSDLTNRLAEIWNFLYLHAPMVNYYKGTFAAFQASDEAKNTTKKYWCTDGEDAFKLKRYNFVGNTWVDAGLWDSGTKSYAVIDLRTYDMTSNTYTNSDNKTQYAKLNAEFKAAIVAHAKKYIGWYINTKSLRFHYAFINHFMAGTDNCSKNTYYVFDPKAVNVTIDGETRNCVLMELHQDDVDTILPIDNNGRKTKPYYIDRMHPYADTDAAKTTSLYEGMNNVLFNLCEEMYEGTRELQSMLNAILSVMTRLVSENDNLVGFTGSTKVSVFGCMWKYMFNIQTYFPVTAYNEQARIRYEYPAMLNFISQGSGARGIAPITQSCGSLLQAEIQFMRRRLIYMASYAAWGNFFDGKDYSVGISDAVDSFAMQAFHLPDSATSATEYKFALKPHQYIYPTGMLGQTSVDPHVRVAPDEEYTLTLGTTTSNDTGMSVLGVNYYHSIGNVGDLSVSPKMSMTVNGKRLTEFIANPTKFYTDMETGKQVPAFRPSSMNITATKIRTLSLKGCTGIGGTLDLSALTRLEVLDIQDTDITNVILPEGEVLKSVALPSSLTRLSIVNLPNLKTLTIQGVSHLQTLILDENYVNSQSLVTLCYSGSAPLQTLQIASANWSDVVLGFVNYLASIKNCTIGGKIAVINNSTNSPSFSDKIGWVNKWGNVDSQSNKLYVTYYVNNIAFIYINGDEFIYTLGKHKYVCKPNSQRGNDIVNVRWELDNNLYSILESQSLLGCNIQVRQLGNEDVTAPVAKLKCYMTKIDGSTLTTVMDIGLYPRRAHLGDYVFYDGTYGPTLQQKSVVGICFYVNPFDSSDRRMVALKDIGNYRWGLYPSNDSNGIYPITLADSPNYNVYDIPTINNIGSRWGGIHSYDGGSNPGKTVLADTPILNYESYQKVWKDYYSAQKNFYESLKTSGFKYTDDYVEENNTVYDIASSGVIVASSKSSLKDVWVRVRQNYLDFTSAAETYSQASSEIFKIFQVAFQAVADMLNNGVNYTSISSATTYPSWLNNISYDYLQPVLYLDEKSIDGFVHSATGNCGVDDGIAVSSKLDGREEISAELTILCSGLSSGSKIPKGMVNTLKIIQHRNNILNDSSVGLPVPKPGKNMTETESLAQYISDIQAAHSNQYDEYYYPAASYCYAYRPTIKDDEVLNAKFSEHHWYLPSGGELVRLCWYKLFGAKYNDDKIGDIFKNAKSNRIFNSYSNDWYWSSSECSQWGAWYVSFGDGHSMHTWSNKHNVNTVRAVAAF